MALAPPPSPPYAPTTELVALAWLRLAVPYVNVDEDLPAAPDSTMRTVGYLQTLTIGGTRDRDVPLWRPVTRVSCWVAPPEEGSDVVQLNAARLLARAVVDATDNRDLMNRTVDLTVFGAYRPARVATVLALGIPRRVDDPGHFARLDVDLQINWTGA
jgi:hypothetical protein